MRDPASRNHVAQGPPTICRWDDIDFIRTLPAAALEDLAYAKLRSNPRL